MATKRSDTKSEDDQSTQKRDQPNVMFLESADADPVKAKAINAPDDRPLTGYETLEIETKDGARTAVGELAGPGDHEPRWRLDNG
jgi:hypothetical protein